MEHYRFTLYIAGTNARSEHAIAQLHRLCEDVLGRAYELVIVDVLQQPEAAEAAKILATPTLIKESPLPKRRITGDLFDAQHVLACLGVTAAPSGPDPAAAGG